MKSILLLLTACFSAQAFAQTDTTETTVRSASYTSVSSLTRAEIERLPAGTFMELVQGAFPFIGNVSVVEEDYTFVVDGFVAVNPNAINLSQIESIHFYPAGTAITRGSLGKKGTFVIGTQPGKSGFDFSTKTGLLLTGDGQSPAGTTFQYSKGFASLNELSYRHKAARSFLTSAVSYMRINSPGQTVVSPNSQLKSEAHLGRIRVSNLAGLQLGRRWSLEGGLFLASQPRQANLHSHYQGSGEQQDDETTRRTLYGSVHAGLRFTPTAKLSNHLVAEASYAEDKKDQIGSGSRGVNFNRTASSDQFQRYYVFSNYLAWKPVTTAALSLEASLAARYRFTRGSEENLTIASAGGSLYQSESYYENRSRSFALSPAVVLNLRGLLTAEVGATYDDYGHSSKGKRTYKKLLPNGGLRLELASLLKGSGISTLEISSTYQKYLTSYDRADLLGMRYGSNLPAFNQGGFMVFPNPEAALYTPSRVWVSSLAVGWWKNRAILKGSYRVHDEMIRAFTSIYYGSSTTYVFMYEPLTARNWSVELKTVVVEKPSAHWTLSAMAFHDQYERKNYSQFFTKPAEALYLDAGKAPLRGGLRTTVTLKRFFAQAAALVNLNEAATDKAGVLHSDRTTYRANFLLAGYTWPLRGKAIKGIELNVQTQNLLQSTSYLPMKYVGLGVHMRF